MSKIHSILITLATLCVAPVLSFAAETAAPAKANSPVFATVNLQQVASEYSVAVQLDKDLQKKVTEIRALVQRKQAVRALIESQAVALQAEVQKARERKDEAATKVAEEKFQQAVASLQDTDREISAVSQDPEFNRWLQEQQKAVASKMRAALQKVASEKNYSLVLDTSTNSAIVGMPAAAVIVGTNAFPDLTQDLIKTLNEAAAAEAKVASEAVPAQSVAAPGAVSQSAPAKS